MAKTPEYEIKAFGVRVLLSKHPQIRRLKQKHYPTFYGNRLWRSSWLLMDYFHRLGLPKGSKVMEIGCGWGLAGIYCAKKHHAHVTGVDMDHEVFPFLRLHAQINGVEIRTLGKRFGGLTEKHLQDIDVLIGADICFWDENIHPLKRLILRARRAGVHLVLIADPIRSPFEKLGAYFVEHCGGQMLDWTSEHPRCIRGKILKIGSISDRPPFALHPSDIGKTA